MDVVAVIMTSWTIFLHVRNTNLVSALAIGIMLVLDGVAGTADHVCHFGAAMMIIVAFTTGTALLATPVTRLVFFQLKMLSITDIVLVVVVCIMVTTKTIPLVFSTVALPPC